MCSKNNLKTDEALKFFEFDAMPKSMKTLNQRYRELAKRYHPDKNLNKQEEYTEKYKILLNHYILLGELIKDSVDKDSQEESDEVRTFETFNADIKNSESHTIIIENAFISGWKQVLAENCGVPVDKDGGGLMHQFDYTASDIKKMLTVTLWDNPSDGHSKILVQSGSQLLNDLFVSTELPGLYAKVRLLQPAGLGAGDLGDGGAGVRSPRPRRTATRGSKSTSKPQTQQGAKAIAKSKRKRLICKVEEVCKFVGDSVKELTRHEKTVHSKRNFNAQRSIEVLEESAIDDDSVTLEEVVQPVGSKAAEPEKPKGFDFAKFDKEQVELSQTKEELCQAKKKICSLQVDLKMALLAKDETMVKLQDQVDTLTREKAEVVSSLEVQVAELVKEKKVLEEQVGTLDKEKKKLKRDSDNAEKLRQQNDLKTKEEYDFVVKKAEVLSEENIMLKEEIALLKKVEESDAELKAMYEETLSRRVQVAPSGGTEVRQTGEQIPELPMVTDAAAGTESSTLSAAETEAVTEVDGLETETEVAGLEARLEPEVSRGKCDLCAVTVVGVWPYQRELREHIKVVHKRKNGSFANCHQCSFNALSQSHLDMHIEIHHKEHQCTQCEYKTMSQNRLKTHVEVKHKEERTQSSNGKSKKSMKSNSTPRKVSVKCKFNLRCKNTSCKFDHDSAKVVNVQNVNPWQPLASHSQTVEDVVPFLEVMTQVLKNLRRGGN